MVVDGAESGWSSVDSGVPQGTVLGPLLFLIFINDLPDAVQSQVRLFADDCLLYRVIRNASDQLQLQRDLEKLTEWTATWGMKFNPSKCTILTVTNSSSPLLYFYSLCGVVLSHVDDAKYLGVTLSGNLQWSKHIQSMTSKCCSTLGLLRRNLSGCPQALREQAYIALVRSRLEYAAAVWDPYLKKDINLLEAVQRRAARFTLQDYGRTSSVTSMLDKLGWLELSDRRRDIRLALLYQITRGEVAIPTEDTLIKYDDRTRKTHGTYLPILAKKPTYENSYFPRTISAWNSLSEACLNAPNIDAFKAQLRPTTP